MKLQPTLALALAVIFAAAQDTTTAPDTDAPATGIPSTAPETAIPSTAPETAIPSTAPETAIPSTAPATVAPLTDAPDTAPPTMATSAVPMTPPTGAPNTTSPVQTFREVVCFNGSTNETDWLDALTDGFDFPGNDDASMWAVEDDGSVSDQECTDGMEMFFLEWNAEADAYVRACLQIGAACTITGWDPLVIMAAVPITPSPPGDDDFPVWAIILIVVGGIGFLGLVAFVIVQQTKKPTFGMSFGDQCCALDEMEHENEMNYTGYSQNNKPGMAM